MKIDIFNINDFIRANNCKEVSNPVFFDWSGAPTPDGLFSYEIFGMTEQERKNIFGYIDLGDHYIHPVIFNLISSRMQAIKQLLYGKKYAVIADKKIKIVDETYPGAETGLNFLYDHFHEIDWITEFEESEMDSLDKKTRLKFLNSLSREEFFVDKWLVLPPAYRDEDSEGKTLGDNINAIYKDIISRTRSMKVGFSFSLFGDETKMVVQNLLKTCYHATLAPASGKNVQDDGSLKGTGKNSMIRKHLLGKTIDFTASNVITAAEVSAAERPEDMPTTFGYSSFPLATLLSLFQPFFIQGMSQYLNDIAIKMREALFSSPEIQEKYSDLQINHSQFDNDACEKLIKKFIKSEDERNNDIIVEIYAIEKGTSKKVTIETKISMLEFKSLDDAQNNRDPFIHPMTYIDLFYILADEILVEGNMHVYVSRYPIDNFQNLYPCRIKISTTQTTKNIYVTVGGAEGTVQPIKHYPKYPLVQYSVGPVYPKSKTQLYNVFTPGNIYLKAMGGDFDGDMMYLKSVFTKEANDEADRLAFAKTNFLGATGQPSRAISKIDREVMLSLFELTKLPVGQKEL